MILARIDANQHARIHLATYQQKTGPPVDAAVLTALESKITLKEGNA